MKPPPDLPPCLGKWLISKNPALKEKAEAALREAEPDTNNLLWTRVQKESKRAFWRMLTAFFIPQCIAMLSVGNATPDHPFRFLWQFLVFLPMYLVTHRLLLRPAFRRYFALVLCLARRGDFRAVPHLLEPWAVVGTQKQEGNKLLIALLRSARPGEIPFSTKPNRCDSAAPLRNRFAALIREGVGRNPDTFAPKQAETRKQVRLWLALLPHFAVCTDDESRDLLRRIACARPCTTGETRIQQAAFALWEPAEEAPSAYAQTAPVWETEPPAQTKQSQRLRQL